MKAYIPCHVASSVLCLAGLLLVLLVMPSMELHSIKVCMPELHGLPALVPDHAKVIGRPDPVHDTASCPVLGLPQHRSAIPLPDSAFTRDRGTATSNYVVGTLNMSPQILLALPRMKSARIHTRTGLFTSIGNSRNTFARATRAQPSKGIFIDVGGYIGDSSFPSAALGIDTYVFEPVRYNSNLMHISMFLNNCTISKHLTIVNAMVGDENKLSSLFVTQSTDNAAATQSQAQANVGNHEGDKTQLVHVVRLDSFFPPGIKVQNLKIDVQGNELRVLKGAERLLRENRGLLKLRFEADGRLLRLAGSSLKEILEFMRGIGYKVTHSGYDIDME